MSLVYVDTGTAFCTPSWAGNRYEFVPSNARSLAEARADIREAYGRYGMPVDAIEALPTLKGHALQVYSCGNPEPVRLRLTND